MSCLSPHRTRGFARTAWPWSGVKVPCEAAPKIQNIKLSPPPQVELAVHHAVLMVVGEDAFGLLAAQFAWSAVGAHLVHSQVGVSAIGLKPSPVCSVV